MNPFHMLAFWAPSPAELIVIMIVALLLFGRRLPEVARNLGKGVVEFKKGLKEVGEDVDTNSSYEPPKQESQSLPYEDPNAQAQVTQPSGAQEQDGSADPAAPKSGDDNA